MKEAKAETARVIVLAHLTRMVGELTAENAIQAADAARIRGRSWILLEEHFRQHPDALQLPGADFPLALVRLAHALIDKGYADVARPACAGCGKLTIHLDHRIPAGRACSNCSGRQRREVCIRCQRLMRINVRRPEGAVCGSCYGKEAAAECGGCGRVRRPAARLADGTVRCQGCTTRPDRLCSSCGKQAPAQAFTDAGPVCRQCYQQPERVCGNCGRTGRIMQRARGEQPDLCAHCYQPQTADCATCGRHRPCHRIASGRPICQGCRPRLRRPCSRCSRSRPVQAEWPMGPVCQTCYEYVRSHPAPCTACGERRPLVGLNTADEALCGPCAGVDLTYTCRRCGHSGDLYQAGCCSRCILAERLTDLLSANDGTIHPDLEVVRQALCAADRPRSLFSWLDRSKAPRLLVELAATGEPITHERLDAFPVTHATHYARELLVTAGVLPLRDEYLERQPVWVEQLLAAAPDHHRKVAAPFAHWFLLRRLRQAHHRRGGKRVHGGTESILRSRLRRTLELLAWLDQQGIALAEFMQPDLDRWLDEGTTTRQNVRSFIVWARKHDLIGDLKVPLPGRAHPVTFIEDDERVEQLHRCIDDDELPLWVRVTGALMLLFGLQGSRVLQLTKDDIVDDGVSLQIDLSGRRLHLPPKLAHLVRCLRDQSATRWRLNQLADTRPWLMPGQSPARPLRVEYLSLKFREYGLNGLAGRNAARLALAASLPASVLADLTGTSVDNAVRWTNFAKRDWTDYVALRKRDTES